MLWPSRPVCWPGAPLALLPVVAVNLVQHLAAGWADARLRRTSARQSGRSPFGADVGTG